MCTHTHTQVSTYMYTYRCRQEDLSIHSIECIFKGRISRPLEKAYIHFKKLSRRHANFHSQLTSPCQLSINLFTTFSHLGRGQCCVTVVLVCSSQMRFDTEFFLSHLDVKLRLLKCDTECLQGWRMADLLLLLSFA